MPSNTTIASVNASASQRRYCWRNGFCHPCPLWLPPSSRSRLGQVVNGAPPSRNSPAFGASLGALHAGRWSSSIRGFKALVVPFGGRRMIGRLSPTPTDEPSTRAQGLRRSLPNAPFGLSSEPFRQKPVLNLRPAGLLLLPPILIAVVWFSREDEWCCLRTYN